MTGAFQHALRRVAPCGIKSTVQRASTHAGSVRDKVQHQYDNIWESVRCETNGPPEVTRELVEASRLQWAYGFPQVPAGMTRLTHGFHYYPASMQAATAKHLLETVMPGTSVADPFVGGGTVLIEALRAGRKAYGADVSPLALFVARGRTWMPSAATLSALETLVAEHIAGVDSEGCSLRSWEPVRRVVQRASAQRPELAEPLWFVYSTALQQAAKARHSPRRRVLPPQFYAQCAGGYVSRVRELLETVTHSGAALLPEAPHLQRSDARAVTFPVEVDAVITSPPYPGVYDYLSHAREVRSKVGDASPAGEGDGGAAAGSGGGGGPEAAARGGFLETAVPSDRTWPADWLSDELGAFRTLKKAPLQFKSTWQAGHTAWITNVLRGLAPGGRMAVQIGDGAGVCALTSTLEAASEAGGGDVEGESGLLRLVGSATLRSTHDSKWSMRTEHIILLERRHS
ncbi:hypothetical protein JKP88DRAFT_204184 [Tribonema minus]|uniref:site-specific DNA-methyltransferase (cytosine-N(4)-specific) n=1 Tax=Tribonema minus TaxID=303371 RepID=A0A836CR36_9STRA|nr:hypothetical protein JKP88DRAFT_204184 [Tribonema minus]